MAVAVVTDSTADIDADLADKLGLRVVPMTVTFGDEEFISGVTLDRHGFYERLRVSSQLPKTSQPNPVWFEEAYADAADDGAEAVVSVHLSSDLSGTFQLARRMAEAAPIPVEVVDSRQVSGTLALSVLAAQRSAERGAGVDEVREVARTTSDAARMFFVVDTLEYLRRGGRLRRPQALVGNMLRVKPLLTIRDGEVVPLEKARTWSRALERLAAAVAEAADGAPVDVVVTHAAAPAHAAEVWSRLEDVVDIRGRSETLIGPVVGTHTGPGAVGVGVVPADVESPAA